MKDYDIAVKFEKACGVRRLLEYIGKEPTVADNQYIQELRDLLDNQRAPAIRTPWAKLAKEMGVSQWSFR